MDKKRITVIISVVVIIIVVLVVVMMFGKKDSVERSGGEIEDKADEMGIYYGGSFNEFQYQEEPENVEEDSTEIDLDEISSRVENIEKEFKKNLPGDIIKEDGENSGNGNRSAGRAVADYGNREENGSESERMIGDRVVNGVDVSNEEMDEGDELIIPHTIHNSGYAEHEVLCDAETQEAAESIAEQIGGVVLTYQNGTATIQIEEDVDTLLERLEQQGSSLELYRHYYVSAP